MDMLLLIIVRIAKYLMNCREAWSAQKLGMIDCASWHLYHIAIVVVVVENSLVMSWIYISDSDGNLRIMWVDCRKNMAGCNYQIASQSYCCLSRPAFQRSIHRDVVCWDMRPGWGVDGEVIGRLAVMRKLSNGVKMGGFAYFASLLFGFDGPQWSHNAMLLA